ncbi:hypothetical protein V6Z12_D04G160000 [Gossypium hirsutum]
MRGSSRPWVRVCQDTINNGKSGTKPQCLKSAAASLKEGKSVFIDRCNLDKEQRVDFVSLGGPEVEVHAVVLDLPTKLSISRIVKRTGHEGNLQGGKAAAVVNRMLQNKELPKLSEGFSRITFCRNETDVDAAVKTYTAVGPLDTLPHGCFGQKDPNAKTQLGIMRFLKRPHETNTRDSVPSQLTEEKGPCGKTQETVSSSSGMPSQKIKVSEDMAPGSISQDESDIPTLAFPSISTADFQFDLEKASDVIVGKVEEFMDKLGNARLVLVDLTERSKILSLVRAKAAEKKIDSKRFFTFIGDICQLYTKGGLCCNAKQHLLVLARIKGLDTLADARKEHLPLLMAMHEVGLRWVDKFVGEDASLVFRLGYHSVPSMRRLHLHVISQDFDSKHLKHKKHWNSFTTAFFRDSVDVMEEINNQGKATIQDEKRLMSMELRCHRCRSAHPNIPRLKSHISSCQAPFPADLQKKGRLVPEQTNSGRDP